MAHKINKKSFSDRLRNAFVFKKEFDIKKIPRMLSIECCTDFCSIKFRKRKRFCGDKFFEHSFGFLGKIVFLAWEQDPPNNPIGFNLNKCPFLVQKKLNQ